MQIQVWKAMPLATDIKVDDIQQIAFEFSGFTDGDGMPAWHWGPWAHIPPSSFDVPQLVLKQRAQFKVVLRALHSAKERKDIREVWAEWRTGGPVAVPALLRLHAVVIKLKNGYRREYRFEDPKKPEESFGPAFRIVFRLLADDSARQVREAVAKVQHTIKAVRGASGREWRNPSDVQAIVAELLKVDRSFFEYEQFGGTGKEPLARVVQVQHDKGWFSIGFVVYDKQLIRRYKWL